MFIDTAINAVSPINFQLGNISHTNLASLISKLSGRFTIVGCIRWTSTEQNVPLKDRGDKCRNVREAVIMDTTNHLPISVWEVSISELTEGHWY